MTVTTPTETTFAAQDDSLAELQAQLAVALPGLSDGDLRGLAARVADELEDRVGAVLSDGLTDAQLAEFEQLVDAGEDERCAAWLNAHRPDYRATVMTVRARLFTETVQTVLDADPSVAIGARHFAQMFPLSLDMVAAQLDSDEYRYLQSEGSVSIGFAETEAAPEFVVDIRLSASKDMLCFVATSPGLERRLDVQQRLHAFVADWNCQTWMPKAVVSDDDATGHSTFTAEIAVPLSSSVTRATVNAVLRQCLRDLHTFYRTVGQQLVLGQF